MCLIVHTPQQQDAHGAWNPPELEVKLSEEDKQSMRDIFLRLFLDSGNLSDSEEINCDGETVVFESTEFFTQEEMHMLKEIESRTTESLWDTLTVETLEQALALGNMRISIHQPTRIAA